MKKLSLFIFLFILTACGQPSNQLEEDCDGKACSEKEVNPPLPGTPEESGTEFDPPTLPELGLPPQEQEKAPNVSFRFPTFESSWGLKREIFERAVREYESRQSQISNRRYAVIIDFSQHSSKKRFYLFDLSNGSVSKHNTSHGKNSDKNNDGWAESFSNTSGSLQSSLGFYTTSGTYQGKYGYSMRLDGRDSTNSNARSRAIVVHPATYVKDSTSYAGRSWGCPALDPAVSTSIINKIKGGAMFYISR